MIEKLITEHLRGIRCSRILDVGPGYADFSRLAAGITGARQITFADCDEAVLRWQADRCLEQGIDARTMSMPLDGSSVAALGDRFDLIHCQEVLEHLTDARGVLRALAGLLTKGGRIVITVPTRRSERWLRFLNPSYMRNEPNGHVNEFYEADLRTLITEAGLDVIVFIPAQPHYFVAHSWLAATRMMIDGSTGQVLTRGIRGFVFGNLAKYSRLLFNATNPDWWSRHMPRNYFVIAIPHEDTR